MTSSNGSNPRSDLVGIELVGRASGSAGLWVSGFVGVLALTILVGLAGPAGHRPAPPIAIAASGPGALVEGSAVEIRGSAIKPGAEVSVTLSVAGRQIAVSEPERSNSRMHRRRVSLRPPAGINVRGVALEDGRLVVRGSAPPGILAIDVEVVGPDGTILASHTVSPPAIDGSGGLPIPMSELRAQLDLTEVAEGLPAGTQIVVGLSWHDPGTDAREGTSFILVVPDPHDTSP